MSGNYFINYATSADRRMTPQTRKYPSDNESGHLPICIDDDIVQTLKYPSDNESGHLPPIDICDDMIGTFKYPSDNESGFPPPSIWEKPIPQSPRHLMINIMSELFKRLIDKW